MFKGLINGRLWYMHLAVIHLSLFGSKFVWALTFWCSCDSASRKVCNACTVNAGYRYSCEINQVTTLVPCEDVPFFSPYSVYVPEICLISFIQVWSLSGTPAMDKLMLSLTGFCSSV